MSSWENKAQVSIEFQDISRARNVGHLMKWPMQWPCIGAVTAGGLG